ncbi:uncharacterized protein MELLADRAFT_88209 [Melampsora larici-populina 98AG31]|uniref:DNA-directed RNA polymerase III subunit RPC9 n=1 Tax=Melampsora larici-populina (strain 98AG31 / pathotype 3-4-7) TaxID=747676 RepID=F4RQY8_MELLP|nr:uncharacterized protein MELLADRAFT_88209 [Melampsora larici-populina 98AG31]EGG05120.1 hypothetical protein MELLADRAFT_88209 [Melampsora larici-populina 98AG31]
MHHAEGHRNVINPRLAHLSAFETLELIRALQASQEQARADFEADVEDVNSAQTFSHADRLHHSPENVQELIYPFVQHFESSYVPQSRQSEKLIADLLNALKPFSQIGGRPNGLTKAERLQICDVGPSIAVEFYLIVEECDFRFSEAEVDEILSIVRAHLSTNRQVTNGTQVNGDSHHEHGDHMMNGFDQDEYMEPNLGDVDDDDALVAEAREGGPAPDQELDEVPD